MTSEYYGPLRSTPSNHISQRIPKCRWSQNVFCGTFYKNLVFCTNVKYDDPDDVTPCPVWSGAPQQDKQRNEPAKRLPTLLRLRMVISFTDTVCLPCVLTQQMRPATALTATIHYLSDEACWSRRLLLKVPSSRRDMVYAFCTSKIYCRVHSTICPNHHHPKIDMQLAGCQA